jgi:hypothetical protein
MNIYAALRHEQKSAQHARNKESDTMWWNPISGEDAAVWNAPLEVRTAEVKTIGRFDQLTFRKIHR